MNKDNGQRRASLAPKTGQRALYLVLLTVFFLFLVLSFSPLSACSMSAMISLQGYTLDDFPRAGLPSAYWEYNDPWDYFGFVMAHSNPDYNCDGYGVVAYRDNDPILTERDMWYKRIHDANDFGYVWYTGHYLQNDGTYTDWTHDVLDDAMFSLLGRGANPSIVLCHARNASGVTYGNHPFTFQYRGKTYSFMHNGYCNSARAFMINQINLMNPGINWFESHPSNYFHSSDALHWVDTEVLFHYIMNFVIASGEDDVVMALNLALARLKPYLDNVQTGVFNFILSDGSKLYAYRNTPMSGTSSHYELSYRLCRDQFYGIHSQSPSTGDTELQQNELVVFSRDKKPLHYLSFPSDYLETRSQDELANLTRTKTDNQSPVIGISPNPFSGITNMQIRIFQPGNVSATIFNTMGQAIWHRQQQMNAPGTFNLTWNGTDDLDRKVAAGVYFIRTSVGNEMRTGKIILIK